MEAVSSMESLGAMDFYEEEDNRTAFLAIRIKEEVELESNQIKDDINNMHDCQQDPDNMQVNELQLFMGKEEEEEDGGNASKVDEGGKTVSVYGDADDMKDEETSPSNMDVRNKNELCTSGVIRMSNLKSVKVCNDIPEKQQDSQNLPPNINSMNRKETVNDKRAGEEEEKEGGNTPKIEEDFKTSIECEDSDAANTPKTDGATENSKEEGQDGVNTSDENDKQAGEEEEKGGGNTTKMEEDFKTSIVHATNATKPSEYAADSRNIQNFLLCDDFSTPFINKTSKIHSKSRCYNESKKIKCQPGFEGFCLPLVTGKCVIAGCINTTGLHLDGEKCLLVTSVQGYNEYKADCHDKKCPTCTNANSLEERLKMCLFLNETSGDSHSTECSPENSSIISGSVQPTHWILGLGIAVLLVQVLTSQ